MPVEAPTPPDTTPPGDRKFCFLDMLRPCSAECLAYGEVPDEPDYRGQFWAHCRLLVEMHRGAKSSQLLTLSLNKQRADQARASTPAPAIDPYGKPL